MFTLYPYIDNDKNKNDNVPDSSDDVGVFDQSELYFEKEVKDVVFFWLASVLFGEDMPILVYL